MVSAIAINKALKKSGEEFLTVFVTERSREVGLVSDFIGGLLEEYRDVMPPELEKKLPPRWVIDHKIELVLGAIPPSQPLYCISPKELG